MHSRIVILSMLIGASVALPALANDSGKAFRLQIGEQGFEIDAGDTLEATLPNGSKVKVTLERNAFATYSAARFSFMHPGATGVSRSDLGAGVVQHMMATAVGSLVIIQTYEDIDPTNLTSFMLKEMTKDQLAAGAKLEQAPSARNVDGNELSGLKATETLGGNVVRYEILAHSNDDSGLMIITRIDPENLEEDGPKIAKFWETLKLK